MTGTVRATLSEIAARPSAEWPALVAERFGGDRALAEQALMWLHTGSATDGDDETVAWIGDRRYRPELRLGRGATATVWQAFDEKLGRSVALKVFASGSSSVLDDALAEARAACDVVSDHVVRVLDVQDDGDTPFIVMELVGEHDVDRDVTVPAASAAVTRPRTVDEALRWVRDVALGVHDAHLRNVFHRDLKPHNVLITPITRRARVADFGLAVSAVAGTGAMALLRRDGAGAIRIAGTPAYMAPEQARGLPIDLDPRDAEQRERLVGIDVWGLGALAYDLLTGHAPWKTTIDAEAWEHAASARRPPPLARTSWGARIPRRVRRVVEKAMAPEPVRRYGSAAELAAELDAVLTLRPTSLDRSSAVRAWLWSRRNPRLSLTALLALGLAIGTLVSYASVRRLRADKAALDAEMTTQEAENDDLERRVSESRKRLAATEGELRARTQSLADVQRALTDVQREYQGIIAAKEKALANADQATRALVDELTETRGLRDAAEFGRALYKGYWTTAVADAERAARERDQAIAAAAQAAKDRDAAIAARASAEKDRDKARVDRDQAVADRKALQSTVERLTSQLTAAEARLEELEPHASVAAPPAVAPPSIDAGVTATMR
ncbi:MAG TPA: protein kinase [Kofleriaceae bacterium]|nr:protein kinase [Kofleriaceae bacterium]